MRPLLLLVAIGAARVASAQMACPAGYDSVAAMPCTPCQVGMYKASADASHCQYCGPGHYQSMVGQASCLPCPGGTYVLGYGASACWPCPSGTTSTGTACEGAAADLGSTGDLALPGVATAADQGVGGAADLLPSGPAADLAGKNPTPQTPAPSGCAIAGQPAPLLGPGLLWVVIVLAAPRLGRRSARTRART
jgi:hypothetical protein